MQAGMGAKVWRSYGLAHSKRSCTSQGKHSILAVFIGNGSSGP